ncbi:MAG: hypothetical protein ACRD3Q_15875 [Terriglobales bacterium]
MFLVLPSIYWRWRGFTGGTLVFFSYLVGIACWLLSTYICFAAIGWWTLIPLCVLGIGVMPTALVIVFFYHRAPPEAGWDVIATFVTAMLMRFAGAGLMASYGIQSERRVTQLI